MHWSISGGVVVSCFLKRYFFEVHFLLVILQSVAAIKTKPELEQRRKLRSSRPESVPSFGVGELSIAFAEKSTLEPAIGSAWSPIFGTFDCDDPGLSEREITDLSGLIRRRKNG
jgi:hypothetical protein